jgi:hypothetical protein
MPDVVQQIRVDDQNSGSRVVEQVPNLFGFMMPVDWDGIGPDLVRRQNAFDERGVVSEHDGKSPAILQTHGGKPRGGAGASFAYFRERE